MTRRPTRRGAPTVVAALVGTAMFGAVLPACDRATPAPPRDVVETRFLERLSAAISGVNAARQRLADDAAAVSKAAASLDRVDALALAGDRTGVRAARPATGRDAALATTVAGRVRQDVTAYERAVAALAGAGTAGLDMAQASAVADVVAAGRIEAAELKRYAGVVTSTWPRYADLDAAQRLWLARSSNGWYRSREEAAGAYVVLSKREQLDRARAAYQRADERRVAAVRTASAAITAARAALAALIG